MAELSTLLVISIAYVRYRSRPGLVRPPRSPTPQTKERGRRSSHPSVAPKPIDDESGECVGCIWGTEEREYR